MRTQCTKHPECTLMEVEVSSDEALWLCPDCEWEREYRAEKRLDMVRGMEADE